MEFNFNGDKFLILDGAMGTMLQKSGLKLGDRPEVLCITEPDTIISIHKSYVDAGADIIYANTFGANRLKLEGTGYSVKQVMSAAINCAKKACENSAAKVALDVSTIGELLEPSGTLTFEEAYDIYSEMMIAGKEAGAELVAIETMTDLYEVKAAILAAKENTELPIMVSMSFEKNGRTFTGCTVRSMAAVVEGLGANAVGINCGLGPIEIYPLAKELCEVSRIPVFIKANAGLPNPETGEYSVSANDFCEQMKKYRELGISMLGGCCGTTPEYIECLSREFKKLTTVKRITEPISAVCTPTNYRKIENVTVIGERINPTGKKLFKKALIENDMGYILKQAVSQAQAGADILDVNVGLPEINEPEMMKKVIKLLQSVTDLPLQIDSGDAAAVEAGLRVYNGKAIVNSVNGDDKVLDTVLPLVKKYGAAVVGLTLDSNGIPKTAQARFEIAKKIMNRALSYGIAKSDIFIDCLTLTVSAQQDEAEKTLNAVKMVKDKLGLKTVLGVSNISFGLPNRELLNHTFLTLAMQQGLDLPIINPNTASMMDAVRAFRVLYAKDLGANDYIESYKDYVPMQAVQAQTAATGQGAAQAEKTEKTLESVIAEGLQEESAHLCRQMLASVPAMDIVNNHLIPALDTVGEQFEKGRLFLPQLLAAASAAQAAFDVVKENIAASGSETVAKGPIVLATVKGDIHDIGKNIVKVILENYGYKIIDLGRDVPVEAVVTAVQENNAPLLGLSALMTTTIKSMEETIAAVKQQAPWCRIMVGGAVLTPDYAERIGADYYAKDAKQSADIAKKLLG